MSRHRTLRRTLLRALPIAPAMAWGAAPSGASGFHGVPIGRGGGYASDFALVDPDGRLRRLADFRGKVVLLFFGYLQCPNYCPTILARLAGVMQRLGDEARRVQVLFITLDPERDTPPALKEYVTQFHPSFLGLYASPQATPRLALDFRVYYRKVPGASPGNYHIDHAVFGYAYDPAGRLRLRLSDTLSAAHIAQDVRRLLGDG